MHFFMQEKEKNYSSCSTINVMPLSLLNSCNFTVSNLTFCLLIYLSFLVTCLHFKRFNLHIHNHEKKRTKRKIIRNTVNQINKLEKYLKVLAASFSIISALFFMSLIKLMSVFTSKSKLETLLSGSSDSKKESSLIELDVRRV